MADPLSVAAGIIAVVTATIQSSQALYDTIESFKNYPQRVRDLLKQILSLKKILSSLHELCEQDESVGSPLKIPLEECGATCEQFREVLESRRGSLSSGRSFYAWISFKFRNGDIVNFMETLAVYKSTIAIAIGDANIRTSQVTLRVLNEYKSEVDATTRLVQQHFEDVLARLEGLRAPPVSGEEQQQETDHLTVYLEQMREEKNSVEHCLQICRRFQSDIEQAQFQLAQGSQNADVTDRSGPSSTVSTQEMTLAAATTFTRLKACGLEMAHAISELSKQATTARRRLNGEASSAHQGQNQSLDLGDLAKVGDESQAEEVQGIEYELVSVKELLHFCKEASSRATPERVHIVEDISVGANGQQICVSTVGDLFKVNKAHAGDGSFQFFGSLAPQHLQELTMLHANQRQRLVGNEAEEGEALEELHDQIHASSASRR